MKKKGATMIWEAVPIVGKLLNGVLDLVDQGVRDKDKADELKAELSKAFESADLSRFQTLVESQSRIVLGEIQGKSYLQRNWRPILMLTVVAIIGNNYLLFPYLSLFTTKTVILDLPDKLYNLMTIGVGGYVAGRTVEKVVAIRKGAEVIIEDE
jgi:hypothetical protein